ncbi:MAG: outer membrane protein assembly factor BamC [Gammaproteobacteria bacterium]|nr:outer membrane protein assembly factor BamC [Gammaproteobacteria bacterium]
MTKLALFALATILTACATQDTGFYKRSPSIPILEIPPDLTQPGYEEGFKIPQIGKLLEEKLTLSHGGKVELHRDGRLRWIEIGSKSDIVWEHVRDFFIHNGIPLDWQNTRLGIMETDWIKLPGSDFFRDRYRVRIEPDGPEKTLIFVAHRGSQLNFAAGSMHQVWGTRFSDEELEIEVMGLMLDYFSVEPRLKQQMINQAKRESPDSVLKLDNQPPALEIHTGFGRAWQLVASAVDRMGHLQADRNKDAGKLVVRLSEEADISIAGALFNKRENVTVRFKELSEQKTLVWLEDGEGRPDLTEEAKNMLIRLKDNLR